MLLAITSHLDLVAMHADNNLILLLLYYYIFLLILLYKFVDYITECVNKPNQGTCIETKLVIKSNVLHEDNCIFR